jgi:hypothetical protein
MRWLAPILILLSVPCVATTRYIAQTAGSFSGGTACNGHTAITPATWNSTSESAGDISYVCGTLTGTAGANVLTFSWSGTSGNPIKLIFDTGASIQSPYCDYGGYGCISLYGLSYILIDGGTPCGTTTGGVNSGNSCNGYIENTLNGAPGATCPGSTCTYSQNSVGIEAEGTTGVEIRNLGIYDIYVHVAEESEASCSAEIDQTEVNSIHVDNSTNISIHDNDMHDAGWHMPGAIFGSVAIYNNQIYNMDHGVANGNSYNTNENGPILIHDNHFGAMGNWDVYPADCDHHDGIHMWGQQNSNTGNINNVYIYGNQFDGEIGSTMNDYIFIEQAVNTVYVFNNDFVPTSALSPSTYPLHCVGCIGMGNKSPSTGTGMYVFNNSVRAAALPYNGGDSSDEGGGAYFSQTTTNAWINNLVQGQDSLVSFGINGGDDPVPCNTVATGIDCVLTNAYENIYVDGSGASANAFGYHSNNTCGSGTCSSNSLTTWQTSATYLDSLYGADAGAFMDYPLSAFALNSNGSPESSSPLRGAGTNLTALCSGNLIALCTDKLGNSRPSSGAWDIGAYEDSATYTITISSIIGHGTVTSSDSVIDCTTGTTGTCSESSASGTVTLTETPASGYSFSSWGGGTCSGSSSTCAVTTTATVTATFTANSSAVAAPSILMLLQ